LTLWGSLVRSQYRPRMNKEPRKGFLGEWDRLSSNMKIVAVILLIIPIFLYPPSVFLYMGYAVYLNIRDKRKK
jgi:hypothetical protein